MSTATIQESTPTQAGTKRETTAKPEPAGKKEIRQQKPLPAPNSDFYQFAETLPAEELAILKRVRAFMETKVAPDKGKMAVVGKGFAVLQSGKTTWLDSSPGSPGPESISSSSPPPICASASSFNGSGPF